MLRKFDGYWQEGKPLLDEVVWQIMPDESSRLAALRTGEIQLTMFENPKMPQLAFTLSAALIAAADLPGKGSRADRATFALQPGVSLRLIPAGFPREINPICTPGDGDTVIVASSGSIPASDFTIGVLAAEVVADSIRDAVRQATSLGGIPDLATPGTRSPDDPAWSVEPTRR